MNCPACEQEIPDGESVCPRCQPTAADRRKGVRFVLEMGGWVLAGGLIATVAGAGVFGLVVTFIACLATMAWAAIVWIRG